MSERTTTTVTPGPDPANQDGGQRLAGEVGTPRIPATGATRVVHEETALRSRFYEADVQKLAAYTFMGLMIVGALFLLEHHPLKWNHLSG